MPNGLMKRVFGNNVPVSSNGIDSSTVANVYQQEQQAVPDRMRRLELYFEYSSTWYGHTDREHPIHPRKFAQELRLL
jgi:hypothetical protein